MLGREASAARNATERPHARLQPVQRGDNLPRRWGPILCFVAAMSAFSLLAAARVTGVFGLWSGAVSGDRISAQQARAWSASFAAALPLRLTPVAPEDLPRALASMALSDAAQHALLAELERRTEGAPVAPDTRITLPAVSGPVATLAPQVGVAQGEQAAPAPRPRQALPLVWITLWDTEAEDGDIVRIDSAGYSRTVTLSHAPIAFAIPLPPDGVIRLTGVHDGGGGITVGASSGRSPIPLPLMSVGQVLGIHVAGK